MILTLREWDDEILRQPTESVGKIDSSTHKIIDDMLETMYAIGAAGLAANQVGIPLSIMLVDRTNTFEPPLIAINPVLTNYSNELVEGGEGCFSLPGVYGLVWRSKSIEIDFLDKNGMLTKLLLDEKHWHSIAAQHEFDHLEGVLFIDKAHFIWEDPQGHTATYKGQQ